MTQPSVISIPIVNHFLFQRGFNHTHFGPPAYLGTPGPLQHPLQRGGPRFIGYFRTRFGARPNLFVQGLECRFVIRFLQGHDFPKQHGKGIDIAALIVGLSQGDFGGHVSRSSTHLCKFVKGIAMASTGNFLGQSKVKNLDISPLCIT
jgi:hypothetical protein